MPQDWGQQGDADRDGTVTAYEGYKESADNLRRCVEIGLNLGDGSLAQICMTAYQQARSELDSMLNVGIDALAQEVEA